MHYVDTIGEWSIRQIFMGVVVAVSEEFGMVVA